MNAWDGVVVSFVKVGKLLNFATASFLCDAGDQLDADVPFVLHMLNCAFEISVCVGEFS